MNYHNNDLITTVCELLNTYLTHRNPDNFDNMLQCFDTLIENIQGPCFENQLTLFQNNFLEMMQSILSIDEIMMAIDNKIKEQKKEITEQHAVKQKDFPQWMYAKLKYKSTVAIKSLLEARKSDEVVIKMQKSINLDTIKRNLIDIYF